MKLAARLQYGPYDGHHGEVHTPLPDTLDVTTCPGCGCGQPLHYRIGLIEYPVAEGFHRYELVKIGTGGGVYRHADTLDPREQARMARRQSA